MFNNSSPSVVVRERDYTNFIDTLPASRGVTVLDANWGYANQPVQITSNVELEDHFGKPNDFNYTSWLSAYTYVTYYSGNLTVVRAIDDKAMNADDSGKGILIENTNRFKQFENIFDSGSMFVARYAGALGNSLQVIVVDSNSWDSLDIKYKRLFDTAPSTSANIEAAGGKDDELHIIVIDAKGQITGTVGTALERFTHLSKSLDGLGHDGRPSFYRDIINSRSRYIYAIDLPDQELMTKDGGLVLKGITAKIDENEAWSKPVVTISGDGTGAKATATVKDTDGGAPYSLEIKVDSAGKDYTFYEVEVTDEDNPSFKASVTIDTEAKGSVLGKEWGTPMLDEEGNVAEYSVLKDGIVLNLSGGRNSEKLSDDDYIQAWDIAHARGGRYYFTGDAGGDDNYFNVTQHVIDITDGSNAIAVISPTLEAVMNGSNSEITDALLELKKELGRTSSYSVYTDNWCVVNDPYSSKDRVIPINAHVAGLMAQRDYEHEIFDSPAGARRGRVKGIKSLVWESRQEDRDDLYKQSINSVVNDPDHGFILYGDRTGIVRNTPFRSIGVRSLFIHLREIARQAGANTLFERNDEMTRNQFAQTLSNWLEMIKGRGGVEDYYVQCDERNNPPVVRQNQQFVAHVMIKPTYSINFVNITLSGVDYDITFDEVIQQG